MGGAWKKNVSFYEAEHFVLFFRNASFCGLYFFYSMEGCILHFSSIWFAVSCTFLLNGLLETALSRKADS